MGNNEQRDVLREGVLSALAATAQGTGEQFTEEEMNDVLTDELNEKVRKIVERKLKTEGRPQGIKEIGAMLGAAIAQAYNEQEFERSEQEFVKTTVTDYPLDKPSINAFKMTAEQLRGQVGFAVENKKRGDADMTIYFSLLFPEEYPALARLTEYDKAVYIALGALWKHGTPRGKYQRITFHQIHHAMGQEGNPSADQRARMLKAVEKMASVRVFYDNSEEAQAYKSKPRITAKGENLLYVKTEADGLVAGQFAGKALLLMEEPMLIRIARERGQITTFPRSAFAVNLSMTNENLGIGFYLLERIAKAKSGHQSNTIRLDTLYKECGITRKRRATPKLKTLLEHYSSEKGGKLITGYAMDDERIQITTPTQEKKR